MVLCRPTCILYRVSAIDLEIKFNIFFDYYAVNRSSQESFEGRSLFLNHDSQSKHGKQPTENHVLTTTSNGVGVRLGGLFPMCKSAAVGIYVPPHVGSGTRNDPIRGEYRHTYLETMMFKGTARRTAVDRPMRSNRAGRAFNALTTRSPHLSDPPTRACRTPTPRLAMDILTDMCGLATSTSAKRLEPRTPGVHGARSRSTKETPGRRWVA